VRCARVSRRCRIDIWIQVLLRNQPETVRMIIENQNALYTLVTKIGWHRRFNDGENFLSPGARETAQEWTANVRHPNPFMKLSSLRAQGCAWLALVTKPWGIHASTVWLLVSSLLLHRCGIF